MTSDTKNPGGWPGAPGVPANPERDGWHWLRYYNDTEPRLRLWDAAGGTGWAFGPPHADPSVVTYLEPALTPAEVAARVAEAAQAAALAMRDRAADRVTTDIGDPREVQLRQFLAAQVRALPAPTNALAAREAAAKAAGMREAARIVRDCANDLKCPSPHCGCMDACAVQNAYDEAEAAILAAIEKKEPTT